MARKNKTDAQQDAQDGTGLDDDQLAKAVRASAQQIWQAGLGAFVKAQQEGAGSFTKLVRDGSELQKRARKVDEATDTVGRAAERATRRGAGSWGKLEQVFEERVARALATIGVPARAEIERLEQRVGELERMCAELAARHAASAPAVRKPAAKKAAAEKVAARRAPRAPAKGGGRA